MISPHAKLSIKRIPLSQLQVREFEIRSLDQLMLYVQKLRQYPGQYAGVIHVVPSDTHPGLYAILDGHHKFAASILTGRPDALCLVVEESE